MQIIDNEISTQSDDLLYLAFIKDGIPIFELDFHVEGMKYDSTLLAGFVSAISSFAKDFSDKQLKLIDQGTVKIGFEEGGNVSLIFMAGSISEELNSKLKLLLHNFELEYSQELIEDSLFLDHSKFNSFKEYALHTFSEEAVKGHYVPVLTDKELSQLNPTLLPNWSDIIALIDGNRTVAEISNNLGLAISEIVQTLTVLRFQGIIDFQILVSEFDVCTLSIKGMEKIFNEKGNEEIESQYGKIAFKLIKSLDGKKSVIQIAREFSINVATIQQLYSSLLLNGSLAHVSEAVKTTLIIDEMYNSIIWQLCKVMDIKSSKAIVLEQFNDYSSVLINLIRSNSKKLDFDLVHYYVLNKEYESYEIFDVFMYPLLQLFNEIEKTKGGKFCDNLKSYVFNHVSQLFGPNILTPMG